MVPTRLLARFDRAALTVVSAPAGFGKTTLLHAWRECAGDTPKALASFAARDRSNALDVGRVLVEALETLGVASAAAAKLASLLPPDGSSFGSWHRQSGVARWRVRGCCSSTTSTVSAQAERDLGRLASMSPTSAPRRDRHPHQTAGGGTLADYRFLNLTPRTSA